MNQYNTQESGKFTHGSLFSGIGGFDLASEWMGWENMFHCEWNEFGQKVLKYYWPKAELFTDITKSDFIKYANRIDILTGGFPCQPYSVAGKRKGKEDNRHLWPEMLRAIREIQPSWVVGENVSGIVSWNGGLVFHEVQTDLENEGYKVLPFILPACAVGAPHRRDRVWFIAYSDSCRNNRTKRGTNGILEQQDKEQSGGGRRSEINGLGNEQDATNANGYGCDRSNSENEKHTSYGRLDALNDTKPATATDTNCKRHSPCRPGSEIKGSGGGNNGKSKEWVEQTEWANGLDGLQWDVADSESRGHLKSQEFDGGEKYQQNDREGVRNTITPNSEDVSNSECERLEGGRREREGFNERHKRSNWNDFPTQSPVCVRDDGLSSELDFDAVWRKTKPKNPRGFSENYITFAKWRNESIKAAGNAIVPQVVYEIFKVIEKMNHEEII